MKAKELLKELMMIPAPSGYEREMAAVMKGYLELYCNEVVLDRVGNCIGKIAGKHPEYPRVMVFGHMDSLGVIVRKIDEDGYLRVERLGGIPEKVLPGTEFIVRSEDGKWYPGVIGPKSHHVTPAEEKYKVETIDTMFMDMGVRSGEEIREMGIYAGCPAIYKPRVNELGNERVSGTSVDNRGACTCLLRIAEMLNGKRPDADVYLVGTVQEEFNLRGAMIAARTVKPDVAIGLDVTFAGDTPDLKDRFDAKLGGGPCVQLYTFHSRGTLNGNLAHESLFQLIKKTAKENKIPLQRTTGLGMLTDASYLQLEGKGVAVMDMGFATRYTHTPVETCDPKDLEELACLVACVVSEIDAGFELNRF